MSYLQSSYIQAVYQDTDSYCDDFVEGIERLELCQVEQSVPFFERALASVTVKHQSYFKYQSYWGLARLLTGDLEAIDLCRKATQLHPFDGDICMNLARAELFLSNRKAALQTIEIGLRFSLEHDGLHQLQNKMGVRRRKPLPVLSRNHPLNSVIGRMMRRKR